MDRILLHNRAVAPVLHAVTVVHLSVYLQHVTLHLRARASILFSHTLTLFVHVSKNFGSLIMNSRYTPIVAET